MSWYRVLLVLHILAIISWMCGILYLYRLFINHVERGQDNRAIHDLLCGMEDRLYRYITKPAMLVGTATGLTMIGLNGSLFQGGWLWVKLASAVLLIVSTGYGKILAKRFAVFGAPLPSSRNLRILNEVPTILMIIIVSMVILRPF